MACVYSLWSRRRVEYDSGMCFGLRYMLKLKFWGWSWSWSWSWHQENCSVTLVYMYVSYTTYLSGQTLVMRFFGYWTPWKKRVHKQKYQHTHPFFAGTSAVRQWSLPKCSFQLCLQIYPECIIYDYTATFQLSLCSISHANYCKNFLWGWDQSNI